MFVVELESKGQKAVRIPLPARDFVVGRSGECDLPIMDPFVSSRNTSVSLVLKVTDLGSRNGTWVNGESVDSAVVSIGESVTIGKGNSVQFRVIEDHIEDDLNATMDASFNTMIASDIPSDPIPTPLPSTPLPLKTAAPLPLASAASDSSPQVDEKALEAERAISAKKEEEVRELRQKLIDSNDVRERIEIENEQLFQELEGLQRQLAHYRDGKPLPEPAPAASPELSILLKKNEKELLVAKSRIAELEASLSSAAIPQSEEPSASVLSTELAPSQENLEYAVPSAKKIDISSSSTPEDSTHSSSSSSSEASDSIDKSGSEIGAEGAKVATAGSLNPSASAKAADALQSYYHHGREELEFHLIDQISERDSIHADLGSSLGLLYSFARDVEKVISRFAQEFQGRADLDQTIMPGAEDSLSLVQNLYLLRGGDSTFNRLRACLDMNRQWFAAILEAPYNAFYRYYEEIYSKIQPRALERAAGGGAMDKLLGQETKKYWTAFCEVMEDLTPDICNQQYVEVVEKLVHDSMHPK